MRPSLLVVVVLTVSAACSAAALAHGDRTPFDPYFGHVHPGLAVATVGTVGAILLQLLERRAGLLVCDPATGVRALAVPMAVAVAFAVAMVVADVVVPFPADVNVRPPRALVFYPVMGYVAEIVFHVAPLALLMLLIGARGGDVTAGRYLWPALVVVALIEPTYQVAFMDRPLSPAGLFVWLHLFAFGLVQVLVYRQHGFVTMYGVRLVYYLCWHVIWGVVRLRLLF